MPGQLIALVMDAEAAMEANVSLAPYIKSRKDLLGGYAVAYVEESDIDKVYLHTANFTTNVYPHVLGLLGDADLEASGITMVHRQPYLNLKGSGVLLGFVDTGIDYTNGVLRYEDGSSKIQYIWDQTIDGEPPQSYPHGTEYSMSDLNRALLSESPHEIVPHVDTVGHGTFMASVAAGRGYGRYNGAAPDSELIVVKLRRALPYDFSMNLIPESVENAFSSADLMLGVQYIIDKAQQLGRPVAICIGLGTSYGSHDGTSIMESYLSRAASVLGTAVCVAAGDESQAAHHANGSIATGESKVVEVRVEKQADIPLSMWSYAGDKMSVAIKSPTGEHIPRIPARPGDTYTQRLILERTTVVVKYQFPVSEHGGQVVMIRLLAATPGVWQITVYGDSVLSGRYHMWLPITSHNPGARFLEPAPNYTITMPGTSTGVITCGAYNAVDGSLSPTTSWGPSRMPSLLPDFVAPGVEVGGTFPGNIPGHMSGTSVAAAITAGACALKLQWAVVEGNEPSTNTARLRANLIAGCGRDPSVEYPNNQWGYGKLNLYNTFRALRGN